MTSPPPTFSFANLLNGSYGVDTPEEVERVRREQREDAEAALRNYKPLPTVDVSESVSRDEPIVSQTVTAAPVTPVVDAFVSFGAEDYLEMSPSELISAFELMVKPLRIGEVLCPNFDRSLFISSVAMARTLLLAPLTSARTLKRFEDLVAAIYLKKN